MKGCLRISHTTSKIIEGWLPLVSAHLVIILAQALFYTRASNLFVWKKHYRVAVRVASYLVCRLRHVGMISCF